MNKKLIRDERKQAKADKKKQKSVRLAAAHQELYVSNTPKLEILPDLQKTPIIGSSLGSLDVPKQPIANHTGSRYGLRMTWCARHADCNGHWDWRAGDVLQEPRAWNEDEWLDPIKHNMNHLEGMDWSEIESMISDSGLRMHHGHDIDDLCHDAISRWLDLGYAEFETLFRFRLGNKKRAWGIELQGHFYLIWYERDHNIYPV